MFNWGTVKSVSFLCMKRCVSMADSTTCTWITSAEPHLSSSLIELVNIRTRSNHTSVLDFAPVNQPPRTIPCLYHDITFISQGLKGSQLPGGGIRIFASALHTHEAGEKKQKCAESLTFYLTIIKIIILLGDTNYRLYQYYIITQVILAFWLVLAYDLLKNRHTIDVIITNIFSVCFKMTESSENLDNILRGWTKD